MYSINQNKFSYIWATFKKNNKTGAKNKQEKLFFFKFDYKKRIEKSNKLDRSLFCCSFQGGSWRVLFLGKFSSNKLILQRRLCMGTMQKSRKRREEEVAIPSYFLPFVTARIGSLKFSPFGNFFNSKMRKREFEYKLSCKI